MQQSAGAPAAADLFVQLADIAAFDVDAVRARWRQAFQRSPPGSLSRDLLARMVAYRIQEQRSGALDTRHRKLLDRLARGGSDGVRRLKPGTVLVREHQEVRHEVMVVQGGFEWQGQTYASLSTIARAITGTAWNGPRFFGLRNKAKASPDESGERTLITERPRLGRLGAVRAVDRRLSASRSAAAVPGLAAGDTP